MTTLVIVESPSKCSKIYSILSKIGDYKVISSSGDICDLDKKSLSIDADYNSNIIS